MSTVKKLNSGFSLMELIMVIAIVALLSSIAPPAFNNFVREERIERAIYKIKYDISYMQNLKYRSTEDYKIAFGDVEVTGLSGTFDYVCFNDLDNDNTPDYTTDKDTNEIITDPLSNDLMVFDFDGTIYNSNDLDRVKLIKAFDFTTGGTTSVIWFDKLGGIQIDDGSSLSSIVTTEGSASRNNVIELEYENDNTLKRRIIVYPLTVDMDVE